MSKISSEATNIAKTLSSTLNPHIEKTEYSETTQHWAKELAIGLALLADHLPRETGNADYDDTQYSNFIDNCRLFKRTYEQHLSTMTDTTPYTTLTQLLDAALPNSEEACAQPTQLNLEYIESKPTSDMILKKFCPPQSILSKTSVHKSRY